MAVRQIVSLAYGKAYECLNNVFKMSITCSALFCIPPFAPTVARTTLIIFSISFYYPKKACVSTLMCENDCNNDVIYSLQDEPQVCILRGVNRPVVGPGDILCLGEHDQPLASRGQLSDESCSCRSLVP